MFCEATGKESHFSRRKALRHLARLKRRGYNGRVFFCIDCRGLHIGRIIYNKTTRISKTEKRNRTKRKRETENGETTWIE